MPRLSARSGRHLQRASKSCKALAGPPPPRLGCKRCLTPRSSRAPTACHAGPRDSGGRASPLLPRTARRGRVHAQFGSSYGLASWQVGRQRERQGAAIPIEPPHCVGGSAVQPVRGVAASNGAAFVLAYVGRRLEYVACHGCQRGAGGTCSRPARVAKPWRAHRHHASGANAA